MGGPTYGWKPDEYFMKGKRINLLSDFVNLMCQGQEYENMYSRDHGNGWLLSHPLKMLLLFQQFCLQNSNFLVTDSCLVEYYVNDESPRVLLRTPNKISLMKGRHNSILTPIPPKPTTSEVRVKSKMVTVARCRFQSSVAVSTFLGRRFPVSLLSSSSSSSSLSITSSEALTAPATLDRRHCHRRAASSTRRHIPDDGKTFDDFVHSNINSRQSSNHQLSSQSKLNQQSNGQGKDHGYTFHIKTYGCQMNVSDSDVVRAILLQDGFQPAMSATAPIAATKTSSKKSLAALSSSSKDQESVIADVLLTNTCAIREKAESKVWQRLHELKKHKQPHQVVGILGCMAERLKEKLLEGGMCDIVVGPDQYRQLPDLIHPVLTTKRRQQQQQQRPQQQQLSSQPSQSEAEDQQVAINVEFSLKETYDDIIPVRDEASSPHSAFVSIQRGCSNRCSFCIVPFTRGGQERSRSHRSIVEEVRQLVETQDLKEVVLLGQNVNSYHDRSEDALEQRPDSLTLPLSNDGFKSRWKRPSSGGYRFLDLVESVSDISPELRVRFTSPHPKDYPNELLELMAEKPNVCSQLHMPAQSGSTSMLRRMKRGYSREAYLDLMESVKSTIPDVALSSDFIAGFCDETEEEHADTLSLLKLVEYDQAFLFAYSMREKTHANRTMEDNVPSQIKQRRLQELIDVFRETVHAKNERQEVGKYRLVLVEGPTKRYLQQKRLLDAASDIVPMWHGRTDQNKRILFSVDEVSPSYGRTDQEMMASALEESVALQQLPRFSDQYHGYSVERTVTTVVPGDYVVVRVTEAKGHTLRGQLLWKTTLSNFADFQLNHLSRELLFPGDADIFHKNLSRVWQTAQGMSESDALVV